MLKPLLAIVLALATLTCSTQAKLPFLVDYIKQIADGVPCAVPCLLDNIKFTFKQLSNYPNSDFFRCALRFVNEIKESSPFRSTRGSEMMKYMATFTEPNVICPILLKNIDCNGAVVEHACGIGIREAAVGFFKDLAKFLDCGVPNSEKLSLGKCLAVPENPAPYKHLEFTSCLFNPMNSVNSSISSLVNYGVQPNREIMCNAIANIGNCYLNYIRPQSGTPPGCLKAVNEFSRQLNAFLTYANCFGNGPGVVECFMDQSLYGNGLAGPTLPFCVSQFLVPDLTQQFWKLYVDVNSNNIHYFIKEIANKSCDTLPNLERCISDVFASRPSCRNEVRSMFKSIVAPSIEYMNSLGSCRPTERPALDSCRCIKDYRVRESIIGTCDKGPMFYTISFTILGRDYDRDSFQTLVNAIKPEIDSAFKYVFGYRFISTSLYKGKQGSILVSFQVSLRGSVTTSKNQMIAIFKNILDSDNVFISTGGIRYKVSERSITVGSVRPEDKRPGLAKEWIVLIAIGSLAAVLFLLFLCLCCCRMCFSKGPRRQVIVPTTVGNTVCIPGINYGVSRQVCQPSPCRCQTVSPCHCNSVSMCSCNSVVRPQPACNCAVRPSCGGNSGEPQKFVITLK